MPTASPSNTQPAASSAQPSPTLAIASCVLGPAAPLVSMLPLGAVLMVPSAVAAIVLGIIALVKIQHGTATGRARAIVGIVAGFAFLVLVVAWINWFYIQNPSGT